MKYFDSHSHINFPQYENDREDALMRMKEMNVGTITVGTNVRTSQEAVVLAQQNGKMWASVGVHPTDSVDDFSKIEDLASEKKVVAVGECGLDFFHKPFDADKQKEAFIKHVDLAQKRSLPLIIHCRNAYDDLILLLEERGITNIRGVMHFFAGTPEQAESFLKLGLYISFAGPITFTDEYDKVIEMTPLNKILIETDAPFAAPVPFRGQRNEPSYVVEVAKKIALVKGVSAEDIAAQTLKNSVELFDLEVSI